MKSVTNETNFPNLHEKEMGDGSISLLATLEMLSFRTKPESICFRKVVWRFVQLNYCTCSWTYFYPLSRSFWTSLWMIRKSPRHIAKKVHPKKTCPKLSRNTMVWYLQNCAVFLNISFGRSVCSGRTAKLLLTTNYHLQSVYSNSTESTKVTVSTK